MFLKIEKFADQTRIKTDIFSIIFTKNIQKKYNCRVAMTTIDKYFMFRKYSCIAGCSKARGCCMHVFLVLKIIRIIWL